MSALPTLEPALETHLLAAIRRDDAGCVVAAEYGQIV
jgi:hypothetical protein